MVRSTRENSSSVDLGTLYSTAFVAIEAVEWRALRIARELAGRPGGGFSIAPALHLTAAMNTNAVR